MNFIKFRTNNKFRRGLHSVPRFCLYSIDRREITKEERKMCFVERFVVFQKNMLLLLFSSILCLFASKMTHYIFTPTHSLSTNVKFEAPSFITICMYAF